MAKKPSDIRVLFGREVRRRREGAGWSQEGFALELGLDRSYFAEIERGEANPTLLVVRRIADGLGVRVAELFDFK
jgi:transcriptional regulator with XRE-family HTH domain